MVTETFTLNMVRKLEQVEANYWMKYYHTTSPIESYGSIISGGFAGAIPSLDILAMNRVLGMSLKEDCEDQLQEIIGFYKKASVNRFFLQLNPMELNENHKSILKNSGFRHHNNWSKLLRGSKPSDVPTNPNLEIKKVDKSNASLYGQIIFMSFDWEDSRLPEWLASTVGMQGYDHYLVYYKKKAIAAGALYTENDMGAMAFAGTLADFRGLGAQTLLLKTRINEAVNKGAKYICAETAEQQFNRPVKSYQNMVNLGFRLAYNRPNWVYETPQSLLRSDSSPTA